MIPPYLMRSLIHAMALGVALWFAAGTAHAQLSRADAVRLITLLGDKNVVVAAVVAGVGRDPTTSSTFGADNVSLVIAYGERDGKPVERRLTFFYDNDLGWFYSEIDLVNRRVRLWTVSGYKELKPPVSAP